MLPVLSISFLFLSFSVALSNVCNNATCHSRRWLQSAASTADSNSCACVCGAMCNSNCGTAVYSLEFPFFYFTCGICIATANGRATLMGGMSVDYACQKRGKRLSRNAMLRICCQAASRQMLRLALPSWGITFFLWQLQITTYPTVARAVDCCRRQYLPQQCSTLCNRSMPHQQCEGWVIWLLLFIYFFSISFLFILFSNKFLHFFALKVTKACAWMRICNHEKLVRGLLIVFLTFHFLVWCEGKNWRLLLILSLKIFPLFTLQPAARFIFSMYPLKP